MWIDEPEKPKEPEKVVVLVDPNPDHQRSSSRILVDEADGTISCVIEVKGLGAILMTASVTPTGNLVFNGMSVFTKEQLHTGRL